MDSLKDLHEKKIRQRVRDLRERSRGRRLPKGFSLAQLNAPAALRAPLNVRRVQVPQTYDW